MTSANALEPEAASTSGESITLHSGGQQCVNVTSQIIAIAGDIKEIYSTNTEIK